jgi:hypothetical protein
MNDRECCARHEVKCARYKLSVMLAAAVIGFNTGGAAAATRVESSGGTYHKPVCPKSTGELVMRCHAQIVTDSKGNPVQTVPPPRNGKRSNP